MIGYAAYNDIKYVKQLWNTAFPEDLAFNEYFFENIYRYENTLVLKDEGHLVSMLQEIPYYIEGIGKVVYIYGVATDPQYRNKGCMSRLLNYSHEKLEAKGIPTMLIPANARLFKYYEKFGYKTAFYIGKNIYTKENDTHIQPTMPNINEINHIYEAALDGIFHPLRTTAYWETQLEMFKNLGGLFLYFKNMGYCFVWTGEQPQIQEIFCTDNKYISEICSYVCQILNISRIEYSAKGSTPFGMLRSKKDIAQSYMNIMFN